MFFSGSHDGKKWNPEEKIGNMGTKMEAIYQPNLVRASIFINNGCRRR
jgi:hypothetical protein